MAQSNEMVMLNKGVEAWNNWRLENPKNVLNFRHADLSKLDLSGYDLSRIDFTEATFKKTVLADANLQGGTFTEAVFSSANLRSTDLRGADLREAEFKDCDLTGANLGNAKLFKTQFADTALDECRVNGIYTWKTELDNTSQNYLVLSRPGDPLITVDSLEVAEQLSSLIYPRENTSSGINNLDTVLLLGNFTPGRLTALSAVKDGLVRRGFLPVQLSSRKLEADFFERISDRLARRSGFIISDLTESQGMLELIANVIPDLGGVEVQPIAHRGSTEVESIRKFEKKPWMLPLYEYDQNGVASPGSETEAVDIQVASGETEEAESQSVAEQAPNRVAEEVANRLAAYEGITAEEDPTDPLESMSESIELALDMQMPELTDDIALDDLGDPLPETESRPEETVEPEPETAEPDAEEDEALHQNGVVHQEAQIEEPIEDLAAEVEDREELAEEIESELSLNVGEVETSDEAPEATDQLVVESESIELSDESESIDLADVEEVAEETIVVEAEEPETAEDLDLAEEADSSADADAETEVKIEEVQEDAVEEPVREDLEVEEDSEDLEDSVDEPLVIEKHDPEESEEDVIDPFRRDEEETVADWDEVEGQASNEPADSDKDPEAYAASIRKRLEEDAVGKTVIIREDDPAAAAAAIARQSRGISPLLAAMLGILTLATIAGGAYYYWLSLHLDFDVVVPRSAGAYVFIDGERITESSESGENVHFHLRNIMSGDYRLSVYPTQLNDIREREFTRLKAIHQRIAVSSDNNSQFVVDDLETLYSVRHVETGKLPNINMAGDEIVFIKPSEPNIENALLRDVHIYNIETEQSRRVTIRNQPGTNWERPHLLNDGQQIFLSAERFQGQPPYFLEIGVDTIKAIPIRAKNLNFQPLPLPNFKGVAVENKLFGPDGKYLQTFYDRVPYTGQLFSAGNDGVLFYEEEEINGRKTGRLNTVYVNLGELNSRVIMKVSKSNNPPFLSATENGQHVVLSDYVGLNFELATTVKLWSDSIAVPLTNSFKDGMGEYADGAQYHKVEARADGQARRIVFEYESKIYLIELAPGVTTKEIRRANVNL